MSDLDPLIMKLRRAKLPYAIAWDKPGTLARVKAPREALERAAEEFFKALAPPAAAPSARARPRRRCVCNKPAVLRAMYEVAAATISIADDERDKAACERTLQAEWKGAYHSHIATVRRYLDTLPRSVREGLLTARGDNDVAIANDPAALRWLLQLARPSLRIPPANPAPDRSVANNARRREIEHWMGAPKGSVEYKRYYEDPAVQAEYREIISDAASAGPPRTADSDVDRRIKEIEAMIGNKRLYTEEVQQELRDLYDRRDRINRSR
jgi:hypothetical protein